MADTDSPSPAVQRRRLRTELRRARLQAGLTPAQVAERMEWSLSKVIRIEAGTVGVSANDLKALLALYKIADEDPLASLLALARAGRERPWQSVYRTLSRRVCYSSSSSRRRPLSAGTFSRSWFPACSRPKNTPGPCSVSSPETPGRARRRPGRSPDEAPGSA